MTRVSRSDYEFDARAIEIAILDRRGSLVWRKHKGEAAGPIRWDGVDLTGEPVEVGDYICKAILPDGESFYLPFVLMK